MIRSRIFVAFALLAAACGGHSTQQPPDAPAPASSANARTATQGTPDAPFRAKAPAPDGKVTFKAPVIEEFKLANGIRVLLSERHELPVVAVRLVVTRGAGDLDSARPGLLSFLGGMLEQGTKKRSALEIDDAYEAIGASHGSWFEWDSGGASLKVLKTNLDAGLDVFVDVLQNPTFPEAEIQRLKARRIAAIQSEKSSPGTIVQNALAPTIFGRQHPYGHTLTGEESDAKALTRTELVRAYDRLFVPENIGIVVAGDVTRAEIAPKLEAAFGSWKAKPGTPATAKTGPKAPPKLGTDKRIVLVDKPGAQSQIQLARPGVPFAVKDRDAIVVTNAIVGGMFSSRVNLNLRERHGYTYGARSYFAMRHGAGPFQVLAPVVADKTIPAIKEVIAELDGIRQGGPTEDELALAKESILLAMPGRFETVADVASALSDLLTYDLPLDYFEKRPARIEAITAEDVKRVAQDLLSSDAMTVIVVGDKAKLAPELETLGRGPFEERDVYGNVVKADAAGKSAAPPKAPPAPAPPSRQDEKTSPPKAP